MEKKKTTYRFIIPDVSLLLVFRDNWKKSKIMRKVIAELLRSGCYKTVLKNNNIPLNTQLSGLTDCAIVSLESEEHPYTDAHQKTAHLFAELLDNPKNSLRFAATLIDDIKRVSLIEIAIKIPDAANNRFCQNSVLGWIA